MKTTDFKISPAFFRKYEGRITLNTRFKYEVFGPFGTGYNIRVAGKSGVGTLTFSRDYAGALVTTPSGKYELSHESIYDQSGTKILQLANQDIISENADELLLALFIVNHHFSLKTGPFGKLGVTPKVDVPSA